MLYAYWLVVLIVIGALCWYATRRSKLSVFVLLLVSFPLLFGLQHVQDEMMGKAVACDIQQKYTVLGFKIDELYPDTEKGTIFLLLDASPPLFCFMPFEASTAEGLQSNTIGPQGQVGRLVIGEGTEGGEPSVDVEYPSEVYTK